MKRQKMGRMERIVQTEEIRLKIKTGKEKTLSSDRTSKEG
jgi:hypothetical protein